MKNYLWIVILVTAVTSCKKNKDDVDASQAKIFWVSKSTTTTGANSTSIRFNRNADGRLMSYVGPSATDSVALTYNSAGKITSLRFTNFGQNGFDYTYDDQGRLAIAQGYNNDGTKSGLSTYTYLDDRIEEVILYPGNLLNKKIYTYTADKKNIASFKWFGTSGNIAEEEIYTYTAVKAPKFGYEAIRINTSENALASTVRISYTGGVAGAPVTFSRKVTANAEGYPASVENSASNSATVSTTTYEYIER